MLKSFQAFEIISCSFVDLWFIIRSTFYNLTAIIQLQYILIYLIRTTISRNILYTMTVIKEESYIIKDIIAISCNLIFSFLSIETKCIFLFETRKKIMQRMLCSVRLTRTSNLIKTINSHNDEYKFLNVQRWRITFLFLINNEYFSIFSLNEFVNVLSFNSSIYLSFDLILFYIYQIFWTYQI